LTAGGTGLPGGGGGVPGGGGGVFGAATAATAVSAAIKTRLFFISFPLKFCDNSTPLAA